MLASIIIPVFRESEEVITRAVDSVKNQVGFNSEDFEIILSMDDPERDLTIDGCSTVICTKNAGPGVARQRGIDTSCGDWVTFLDADDIFYNLLGLNYFRYAIRENPEADIIKFPFLEEHENLSATLIEQNVTWCFAKFFRRGFLDAHKVRFDPFYRVHEDSYFCRLCELYEPHTVEFTDPFYLWHFNENSTVRANDGIYWQTSFPVYIDVIYRIAKLRSKAGKGGTIRENIYNFSYCYVNISRMDPEHAEPAIDTIRSCLEPADIAALELFPQDIACCLKDIEAMANTPVKLPRFTVNQFFEILKGGKNEKP